MALPEVIYHQDRLMTIHFNKVPLIENVLDKGVHVNPCYLDPEAGIWVLRALFEPGLELPMHFHTGAVHLFTTKGAWHYKEYPKDMQTAGSYLYEPGGSIHTLVTPSTNTELTETLMHITGSNINFTPEGEFINLMDAGFIINEVARKGKEQGKVPVYFTPGHTKITK